MRYAAFCSRVRDWSSSRVICACSSAAWNSVIRRFAPGRAYEKSVPVFPRPRLLL